MTKEAWEKIPLEDRKLWLSMLESSKKIILEARPMDNEQDVPGNSSREG